MNVTDDDSIRDAFMKVFRSLILEGMQLFQIDSIVGEDGVNLLINDQGVLLEYALDVKPNRAQFTKQLDVNTASILIIAQVWSF